jgi:3-oxoacyl-[acyl-carrier protein] reductase
MGTPFVGRWAIIARMSPAGKRVALVTGSSRGLGRVIATRLAQDGMAVAVNGVHTQAGALEAARAIRDAGGVAEAFEADVTDEQQVAELVVAVADRLGPVDVLVLNATGPQPEAPVAEVAWSDPLDQLDSDVVDQIRAGRSAYVTAKSAQVGLTRSWVRELAPSGITVNTIAPGFIPVERHADVPDEVTDAYLASVPAGRMGTPQDVAHAVSFFASEGAGFLTGQRLVVDGGRGLVG